MLGVAGAGVIVVETENVDRRDDCPANTECKQETGPDGSPLPTIGGEAIMKCLPISNAFMYELVHYHQLYP